MATRHRAMLFCYQDIHHGSNTNAIKKILQQFIYDKFDYLTVYMPTLELTT